MPNDLNTIASYLPILLRRQLAANPTPLSAPSIQTFSAAFLFGDITGFTPLTVRLAQQGAEGVEGLSHLLSGYFDKLINLIMTHGGDILKIAGDAVLVIWPVTGDDERVSLQRAAQCALAIQTELHNYKIFEGAHLSMRIGLSCGQLSLAQLGGVFGRWEAIASGIPIIQASLAEARCKPGQVILAPEALALAADAFQMEIVETNGQLALNLLWVEDPPDLNPISIPSLALEAVAAARAYIPGAILQHLASGHATFLSELRRLTVIFINLPSFESIENIDEAQTLIQTLQRALYHYEGSVNQLIVDDKGTTLVAALGLPPLAHEDDPVRGMLVALEMAAGLQKLHQQYAIGITSGQVYCGERGNAYRREYALLGDSVNTSARLMQAVLKAGGNDIFCDAATYQAAKSRIDFETLAPVMVKGKVEPIAIYRPLQEKSVPLQPRRELIGRQTEKNVLSSALQSLMRGEIQGPIIIEGEAGLGKSRLVEEVRRQAQTARLVSFSGNGDAIERSSAYHAWRDAMRDGFGLLPGETQEEQRAKIWSLLPEYWRPYAPLLNVVLPLNFPETETTATLTQQARLDQTRALLDDLLFGLLCSPASTILILEDAHWFDTASWAIVVSASQLARKLPLLLIVTTRPIQDAYSPEYIQLQEQPETRLLRLSPLAEAETTALVRQHLQTAHVGTALNAFIEEQAEGNPFFVDEILLVLQESGFLNHSADSCDLKLGMPTQNIGLPDTIQGLITNRIDRLNPAEQMTLKVASVLGRTFSIEMVRAIYPPEAGDVDIAAHLKTLQERGFIAPIGQKDYIFNHALTRDTIYNHMLFAQRRKLHRAIAEKVEQIHRHDLDPYYALLAYHWQYAIGSTQDDLALTAKALDALEKAGEQASRRLTYFESAEFFSHALALAAKLPADLTQTLVPKLRQMRWLSAFGIAQVHLGRLAEARQVLGQAAQLGGYTIPETNAGLYLAISRETIIQIWHRLRPKNFIPSKSNELEQQEYITCEGLNWLFSANFLSNNFIQAIVTTLMTVNIAENLKNPPKGILASCYGILCFIANFVGQNRLSNIYERLSLDVPLLDSHPIMRTTLDGMLSVHFLDKGEWKLAKIHCDKVLAILERQPRAYYLKGTIFTQLSFWNHFQGNYMSHWENAGIVGQLGRMGNNMELQLWDLCGQIMIHTALGKFDALQISLDKSKHLLPDIQGSSPSELFLTAYQAKLALVLKQWDKAETDTKKLEQIWSLSPMPVFWSIFGKTICAEVPLTQWKLAHSSTDPAKINYWRSAAKRACGALTQFARLIPIGKPDALRCQGDYDWLNGNPAKAQRNWQASLEAATQLSMPHQAALAHWSLGHLPGPQQSVHRQAAREILEGLGALAYFEYLETLL